uniref:(California timema) hypothetical protein n=1 Tax=Timema californicum TaxID=61474 RepID=A0A7R9IWM0_TIMCA|nr:unnamed protein product [Timema californicum]
MGLTRYSHSMLDCRWLGDRGLNLDRMCPPASGDMTLPVSSYEELLARVRSLTDETIQLQRELTTPLLNTTSTTLDYNENERVLTSCDVTTTCDNKRGVSLAGWTTPTGRQTPPPAASWSNIHIHIFYGRMVYCAILVLD